MEKPRDTYSFNEAQARYRFVDEDGFEKNKPQTFAALAAGFTEYRQD